MSDDLVLVLAADAEDTPATRDLLLALEGDAEHRPTAVDLLLLRGGPHLARLAELVERCQVVADLPRWRPTAVLDRALFRAGADRPAAAVRARRLGLARRRPSTAYLASTDAAGLVRYLPAGTRVVTRVHAPELDGEELYRTTPDDRARLARATHRFLTGFAQRDRVVVDVLGVEPSAICRVHELAEVEPPSRPADARAALVAAGVAPEARVVGAVAGLGWWGGGDLFVRLAWLVDRRCPDPPVHFVAIGDHPEPEHRWQLDHEVTHMGLGDRFHVLPADRADLVAGFDVAVQVGREDPDERVYLPPARAGCPIVGFDHAPLVEFSRSGGAFTAPYLRTDLVADQVAELLRDDARRASAGAAARDEVLARHGADHHAAKVWDAVVGAAGSAR